MLSPEHAERMFDYLRANHEEWTRARFDARIAEMRHAIENPSEHPDDEEE